MPDSSSGGLDVLGGALLGGVVLDGALLCDGNLSEEEVLYTTIDHSNSTTQRKMEHDSDDVCDYAIVNMPSGPGHKATINEDCTDDYVLMS
ncbi:hypothetical protein SKAU_G00229920 [Synaphobranchus kaupii]|uniref:Uncharacterized protein n=1 Tax=Synaphobranchus kaupii TaxID=118154 RepID=A0A9Q1F5V6_SYNKA|nr:hypothetical protein SKAU_G00229920 [Synaphobranchus kaupii]